MARPERKADALLACLSGDLNACADIEGEKPARESLVALVRRAWEAGREADLRGIYRLSPASEPPDYYSFLYGLCRTLNVTNVLEIGTDRGGSAVAMRKAIDGEAGQLVTVDLTDASDAQLAGRGDIVKIRGDAISPEVIASVLSRLAAPVDVLYIDTEHDFKTTLAAWSTYVAVLCPRVIVFDDITLNGEMRRFWALMLVTYGDRAVDATSIVPEIRSHPKKPGFGVIVP